MRLILLGAPGAGKGTQAELINKRYHIPVIGTGNLIREAVNKGTEYGLKAKSYMDSGQLVPDDIVIDLLKVRIAQEDCKDGFVLDGFPRNVAQAQMLDKMGFVIDKVIDIEVSDEHIISRLSGRRVCGSCGSSYHLQYNPPKTEGVCNQCGHELIVRGDDKPETVKERLKVYHDVTEPLKDYYNSVGKLYLVVGQKDLEETTKLTIAAIEA